MKIHQILVEYRRDITAQNLGDRLLVRLAAEPSPSVPDELYQAYHLVRMAQHPEKYPDKNEPVIVNVLGNKVTVSPATSAQVLQQMRGQIIDHLLAYFEEHDPTKTKTYVPWLLRSWINDRNARMEDVNRNDLLGLYQAAKNRNVIRPEHRDINKFKTWREFEDAIRTNYSEDDLLSDAERKQRAEAAKGSSKEVYEDPTVRVVHPEDEKAACYYGQGTQWCTAATRGYNRFDSYNKDGPLFILLPKKPAYDGEKYQVHLASGQFMDEQDSPVSIKHLMDRFPNFFDQLRTKLDPEHANDLVVFNDPAVLKRLADKALEYAEEKMWDVLSDWEIQDDYWSDYRATEARKRGYVDDDGDIDWERVYQDDDLNDYTEFNDYAGLAMRDFDIIKRWSGDNWREFVLDAQGEYDQNGYALMSEFNWAIAEALDREFNDDSSMSDSLSDFIKKRLQVVRKDDQWDIERKKRDQ
jgi:hypothetical protein